MSVPNQSSSSKVGSYGAIPIPNRSTKPSKSMVFHSPYGSYKASNSLTGFASSYHRAQSFRSLEPRYKASRSYFQDDEALVDPDTFAPSPMGRKISHVLQSRPILDTSVFDEAAVDDASFADHSFADLSRAGSLHSYAASMFTADDSFAFRQVEDQDGKVVTMLAPRSTVAQTVFNSINVLIGIGLLALSKAMNYSGWYGGCFLLVFSACITYWTATLLSECMDTDPTLGTYADLGYKAFGSKGRLFISCLFSIELIGVGVSLIVLFADSLNALFPEISVTHFKLIAFCVLTPFSFLSLRVLSSISLLGIMCTISLVVTILLSGLTKPTSPGSLVDPMPTNIYPPSFHSLMVSFGIILGPFGSHSLFPALKSDLAQPEKFEKCLKITYSVGFLADVTMALIGFAMFGAGILNEITQSVLVTQGYPQFVYLLVSVCVSMVPIAKTPINAMPVISILEFTLGISAQQIDTPTLLQSAGRAGVKLFVNLMFVVIAIIYPEFDKIIGLSGASLCTIICIILPCAFYLKLCRPANAWFYHLVIVLAALLGIAATTAAITD
ncbi:hypothetical protein OGAPHI_005078 [Ogataea philodendri]|uniref:Amino acid transporter transmembrane domain-containing protein n=1 Tax=Ogataea philodendri TaxID=1378263 RepID=A0A9P8P1U6_9ASCO|nr:uncharacterized protein OGAPHI_005078 [Ogataea philodendri]KAH3663677.1 hypothetical protein OGAPHI_005078 [Ogataea philodendri]